VSTLSTHIRQEAARLALNDADVQALLLVAEDVELLEKKLEEAKSAALEAEAKTRKAEDEAASWHSCYEECTRDHADARAEEKMAKRWVQEICGGLGVSLREMAHNTAGITRNCRDALLEVNKHDQGYLLRTLERERNEAREMLDHARRMLTDCQRELVEVKSERDDLLYQQAAAEDERKPYPYVENGGDR
jgi:hypothetical protein